MKQLKQLTKILLTAMFGLLLIACSNGKVFNANAKKDQLTENGLLKMKEKYSIQDVHLTITDAYFIEERNEVADEVNGESPEKVVKVEYRMDNESAKEITVGADLSAFTNNEKSPLYSMANTLETLPAGRSITGAIHFVVEGDVLELEWNPEYGKPSEKGIWEIPLKSKEEKEKGNKGSASVDPEKLKPKEEEKENE